MTAPTFGSHKVIDQRISEANLRVFDAGFDQGKYRLKSLADVIMAALPEFALGYKPNGVPNERVYSQLNKKLQSFPLLSPRSPTSRRLYQTLQPPLISPLK